MNFIIILINYKNWKDTSECIHSLLNVGIDIRNILVVDNYSQNDSIEKLRLFYNQLEIIETSENLGFSGGNNFGFLHSKKYNPEFVVFLNNDTILKKNSIEILINEIIRDNNAIAGTGLILYYPQKEKIWYAGGKLIYSRGLAVHNYYNQNIKSISYKLKKQYVNFISGCFICVKTDEFEEIGMWDESFFLYLEDIELSARINNLNKKMLFVPDAEIFHKCNGENSLSLNMLYYSVRNRKLLIKKRFIKFADYYFNIVIFTKMLFWLFTKKEYFDFSLKAIKDFRRGYFGVIKK